MLLCRIDILVAQNICYEIDIPCFLVQSGAVCAAELVRRDLLGSRDLPCILFNHVFHSLHAHPVPLGRVEESVLLTFLRDDRFPLLDPVLKSLFDFTAEIYDRFRSPLADDLNTIVSKIDITDIKSDTFTDTYPRSEKQGDDRQVADLCLLII